MTSALQVHHGGRHGLEFWVGDRVQGVLLAHQDLTIEGWEELYQPPRNSPLERARKRIQLNRPDAIKEVLAAMLVLAVTPAPWHASAEWVAYQAGQIAGAPMRLGPAIAGAILAGYEPLRDNVGPGCGFRKRSAW